MYDGPLIVQGNLSVVDTLHPQRNKVITAVKFKVTVDSKLNAWQYSLGHHNVCSSYFLFVSCKC